MLFEYCSLKLLLKKFSDDLIKTLESNHNYNHKVFGLKTNNAKNKQGERSHCDMVYMCTIGVLLERRQGLGLVPLTAYQRAGGQLIVCRWSTYVLRRFSDWCEADDDSLNWAVSILASRYLPVPLRRYFCVPFIITQII